ncbi:hypothetical protein [Thermoanaerobacterium thermosaccharolyticum]|uniref:hypothetical protein n=1 Tax=Thermoanaerobacterium thermosaccharolyticum TaxID=1517 RepID=UPI003DA951FC
MAIKKFTVNTRIDYSTLTKLQNQCREMNTTPSSFLRDLLEKSVDGKNICTTEKIYKTYNETANIFYDRNNIYVIGNISIEEDIIKNKINEYVNQHKNYDVINVIYTENANVINIERKSEKNKQK